jgi:hypothetical protein
MVIVIGMVLGPSAWYLVPGLRKESCNVQCAAGGILVHKCTSAPVPQQLIRQTSNFKLQTANYIYYYYYYWLSAAPGPPCRWCLFRACATASG